MRRSLVVTLLALLCGCQPANMTATNKASQPGLAIERIAQVVVSDGTSRVMGTVRLPESLLGQGGDRLDSPRGIAGAELTLLDASGQPIPNTATVRSDAEGLFSIPSAPLGVSMVLRAQAVVGSRTLTLKKLLRPSQALTCAHLDLASTVIADKLLSAQPLLVLDPGLVGADLFELFNPVRLQEVEKLLRRRIDQSPPPGVAEVGDALAAGDTSQVFDLFAAGSLDITNGYQDVFERPDSSLVLRISAVGTNSVGIKERPVAFGVLRLKVFNAPEGTTRVEFWAKSDRQIKIGESAIGPEFESTFDTWSVPDGDYTFDTIVVTTSNRRKLLGQTFVTIQNTLENFCPLP
ncbi:MAG TPA: hypothetical protein V6D00_03205 [Pantanalinema sp.]